MEFKYYASCWDCSFVMGTDDPKKAMGLVEEHCTDYPEHTVDGNWPQEDDQTGDE